MKTLILGGTGFIGSHLARRLKKDGHFVHVVDIEPYEYGKLDVDRITQGDLKDPNIVDFVIEKDVDLIFQLAADMGGSGYVFVGSNDADIMHNSALINLNVANFAAKKTKAHIFYSSSACMYPSYNQLDPSSPKCSEDSAYPADPDSEYGWEKLFSERLYLSYMRNKGLDVRIARFHNIFGPLGTWDGGREKAPAAICRKVAQAKNKTSIEIWGDGEQTRSFLYIDECLDGVEKLMDSTDFIGPVNIGSEEMVTINDLAKMAIDISGKKLDIVHVPGPQGVRGRNSDNKLIREKLGWAPSQPLRKGMERTYAWIAEQVKASKK